MVDATYIYIYIYIWTVAFGGPTFFLEKNNVFENRIPKNAFIFKFWRPGHATLAQNKCRMSHDEPNGAQMGLECTPNGAHMEPCFPGIEPARIYSTMGGSSVPPAALLFRCLGARFGLGSFS